MVRIAAIADIHANGVAFEAVIHDLRRHSPDLILCLGDIVMRGPQPAECVAMLRSLGPYVTVRGNFDHRFTRFSAPGWAPSTYKEELALRDFTYTAGHLSAADQQWLAHLPLGHTERIAGVPVELYHAAPDSLSRYTWPWAPPDELATLRAHETTKLVLFGHMHHPFVRSATGFTLVNTGSVGLSFDGDSRASYALIDLDGESMGVQIRRVPYDVEEAIAIARERAMPDLAVFAYALRRAAFPYNEPLPATEAAT